VACDGRSFVIFQNNQFADRRIERSAPFVSRVRSRAPAPIPRSALICEGAIYRSGLAFLSDVIGNAWMSPVFYVFVCAPAIVTLAYRFPQANRGRLKTSDQD
jgi:hypothetical protein